MGMLRARFKLQGNKQQQVRPPSSCTTCCMLNLPHSDMLCVAQTNSSRDLLRDEIDLPTFMGALPGAGIFQHISVQVDPLSVIMVVLLLAASVLLYIVQEFPYPLTCWQQTVSALVFLAYAAIGMVLRVLTWPVRKFGYALAVGFGARMLSSNEYKHLWLSAHNLGWVRFQTAAEQRGLMHLFDEQHPNLRKCWTEALNVIIIVSGLLTTSSYQALFSGYPGDASTGAVATLQSCFRAANAISFLASVVTIVVSALLIMALHKFASLDGQSITLTPWSRALLYLGYQLAVYAFFASLAAALAAVGFASYGFFADNGTLADSIVLWCVLWVSVSLVVIGGLVTAIRPVKQKERRKSVSTGRSAATSPVDSKPSALGCTTPDPKPDAGGGEVQVDLRLHLLAVLIAQKLERLIESQQSMELALKDFTKAARQSPLLEGNEGLLGP